VGVFTVDGAANRVGGTQHLLAHTSQVLGHRSLSHDPGSAQDIVPGDVTVVEDVLDLLSVTWGLLERLDDHRASAGHNADGSLTVLDGQLDGDLQALPLLGVLANIVTNLLGRKAERADLGRQRGSRRNFATDGSQANRGDGGRVKLGRHLEGNVSRQRR